MLIFSSYFPLKTAIVNEIMNYAMLEKVLVINYGAKISRIPLHGTKIQFLRNEYLFCLFFPDCIQFLLLFCIEKFF